MVGFVLEPIAISCYKIINPSCNNAAILCEGCPDPGKVDKQTCRAIIKGNIRKEEGHENERSLPPGFTFDPITGDFQTPRKVSGNLTQAERFFFGMITERWKMNDSRPVNYAQYYREFNRTDVVLGNLTTVKVLVKRIRNIFKEEKNNSCIKGIWGEGYVFNP